MTVAWIPFSHDGSCPLGQIKRCNVLKPEAQYRWTKPINAAIGGDDQLKVLEGLQQTKHRGARNAEGLRNRGRAKLGPRAIEQHEDLHAAIEAGHDVGVGGRCHVGA